MRVKYQFILISLSLLFYASYGKQKPRNLKIGDQVPSIFISKVVNDKKKSFTTSEFKQQLLILDFWATTCKACIEGLPKVDSLQKEFGGKIKILPVTYETEHEILAFMKRNKIIKGLIIPSVVEDKSLSKWFRNLSQPHEVWIYKNKVVAITTAEYVDAKNIQMTLDGKTLKLPVKDDFYEFQYEKPFLAIKNSQINHENHSLNYIAITGYQEGALPRFKMHKDSISGLYRTYFINHSILAAYGMLWNVIKKTNHINSPTTETSGMSLNQIILEVKNKEKYIFDPKKEYNGNWHRKYDISYEWISPDTVANKIVRNQMILNDLDRLLGLHGRWEKRAIKCLILIRTNSEDKLKSRGGDSKFEYQGPVKQLHNIEISNLVYYLNNFSNNPPAFDETNYKNPVDLNLNFKSWTDISALRKVLQTYGLDLKEEFREIDMFVLTESTL